MTEKIELSDFIAALSADLAKARTEAANRNAESRFGLAVGSIQVELSVTTETRKTAQGEVGARFYVISAGAKGAVEAASQQVQKVTLSLYTTDNPGVGA